MNEKEFQEIFRAQIDACHKTLFRKGVEYATDIDRLHNFKVAAALQGESSQEALAGMLAKHIVSIFDMVKALDPYPMDMWDEKIGDAINYLILLKAILMEH
jgi:hypothetical protein